MDLLTPGLLILSLLVFAQALFSLYLMLYAWQHPDQLERNTGPRSFDSPEKSFTVLLPARDEQEVIGETIRTVCAAHYPRKLLEVVVICHASDHATIAEALKAASRLPEWRIAVEIFGGELINKPRALNVGLARTKNDVVTVFDAEDDIDPDVFNVVNTVMRRENVNIVQAGVQLMSFRHRWYSIHNCLEYFFWFKSRLHFHSHVGMVPLGGNTIFMRRTLIDHVGGWDEACLTEDADIGLRLSALGEPIRVVYDPQHVTREETPPTVMDLVRQRTRWHQGFLHVLRKGTWLDLPNWRQRLLAFSTLSYPILQVPLMLLWPLVIVGLVWIKVPVIVAIASFLPLYATFFQLVITIVGAAAFAREYGQKLPRLMPLWIVVTFLPYQWLLGASALRAVLRELRGANDWEKTEHVGAHRIPSLAPLFAAALGRELQPAAAVGAAVPLAAARSNSDVTRLGLLSMVAAVRTAPSTQAMSAALPEAASRDSHARPPTGEGYSICPNCQRSFSPQARFCRRCGHSRYDVGSQ